MAHLEKISIALPPEMATVVRQAVDDGEYASSSEVIQDALREWTVRRDVRRQSIAELRHAWQEALQDDTPGVPMDDVLNTLERKYKLLSDQKGL